MGERFLPFKANQTIAVAYELVYVQLYTKPERVEWFTMFFSGDV